ncbi:hypothetical protein P872_03260 [Rhodonellum psychrophilum GCM71 = DSM 17998]|uniref:Uncharacterized protein n=1 Tax=Rhodonellum psychrophilum GCM71 = DSM 17998 TaxID=1123057 RepID=U5BS48_9BACT|nr:hypothetical protein P872_03260 [Rhodonellum psychrophilum GCM71 = DSM 17998]
MESPILNQRHNASFETIPNPAGPDFWRLPGVFAFVKLSFWLVLIVNSPSAGIPIECTVDFTMEF